VDWVDPHGLWTAAPDSPVAAALRAHARAVIAEIEAPPGSGPCAATHELGTVLSVWVGELRSLFEAAEGAAPTMTPEQAFRFASLAAFEDGPVTRPARSLATELGYRAGVVRRSLGVEGAQAAEAVRERLLPGDTMDWSAVILAGAVRAYLPQIDPHGGWAPLDEETSLYEIDLEASPPPRLWRKMTRTAVGVRVEETHVEGLAQGDVVLRVGDTATAGLSVEQCEQLSLVDVDGMAPLVKRIAVLSAGPAKSPDPRTRPSPTSPPWRPPAFPTATARSSSFPSEMSPITSAKSSAPRSAASAAPPCSVSFLTSVETGAGPRTGRRGRWRCFSRGRRCSR
jgi:carboxyl-terminal processing protease